MPRGSEKGGVTSGRLRNQISQSLNRRNPLGEGGRVHKLEMQPAQPSYIQKKDQKLVDPLGLQATYLPVTGTSRKRHPANGGAYTTSIL